MIGGMLEWVKDAMGYGYDDSLSTPTPLKTIKSIVSAPRLRALLPHNTYDSASRLFYMDAGETQEAAKRKKSGKNEIEAVGFCMELLPQTGANESMAKILETIFTTMPGNSGLQISLYASPRILAKLKESAALRQADDIEEFGPEKRSRNIFRAMQRRRFDHYMTGTTKPLFKHLPYVLRDFRLTISYTRSVEVSNQNQIDEVVRFRESLRSTLRAAGFPSRDWDADDLVNYLVEILNPQKTLFEKDSGTERTYDDGRLIRDQAIDIDTPVYVPQNGESITFGGENDRTEMRLYYINDYPRNFALWGMGNLIGDAYQLQLNMPCPFLITMGVQTLDYESNKQKTMMKSARATTNAESPMAKFLPDVHEKKRDWDIANYAYTEGRATVHMYHHVMLFAPQEKMNGCEQLLRSIFTQRNFGLSSAKYMQIPALLGCFPMTLSGSMYADYKLGGLVSTKTTTNAIHLAPMLAEWKGTGTPAIQLFGKRGQLMNLCLFDNSTGNYNFAIAAGSGSGKSVFMNEIANAYRGMGAKVWVIDVGGSYRKLSENIDGEFIEFDPETTPCMNPFTTIKEFDDEVDMLKQILGRMASATRALDDYELAQLEKAIGMAWEQKGNLTEITDVAEILESLGTGDNSIERRMAVSMYPYTRNGVHGRYFNGPATIDFSSDFIVLELEHLKSKKDLQAVVLMIMMYRITQEMYLDRSRRKIVLIDEAWDLMGGMGGGGNAKEFIENGYRRARKYGGAFGMATQSIDDFYKNEAAKAAFENADWLFMLKQKKESIEALEKSGKLMMNEGMKYALNSLTTEHGYFSQIYIHSPAGSGVGMLMPDPFSLLIASSKTEDTEPIRKYREQGMSLTEAMEQILKDRGVQ